MKIVLLNNTLHDGQLYEAGEQDVEDEAAEVMLASGVAYEAGELSPAEQEAEAAAAAKAAAEAADEAIRREAAEAAEKHAPGAVVELSELLDGNIDSVLEMLPTLTDDELQALLVLEQGGKTRKGVIDGIAKEQAERAG